MAIIRKDSLTKHLEELDARFQKLRKEVEGYSPNANIYEHYEHDCAQYEKTFTEVNLFSVDIAISDFQTILKSLKTIKRLEAKKLQTVK